MLVRSFSPRSYRSIFKWGAPDVFYDVNDRLRAFVEERLRGVEERWTFLRKGLAGLEESCHLLYPGKGFLELMCASR